MLLVHRQEYRLKENNVKHWSPEVRQATTTRFLFALFAS